MKKLIIGWREWCSLEKLGINRIEFKTDTGATLSALHATHITTFFKDAVEYVQFVTQPLKKKTSPYITCIEPIIKRKIVTSSNGMKEKRIVIRTTIELAGRTWPIDITLTNRTKMTYRMLLGRQAMKQLLINPKKSFFLGKLTIS